MKTGSSLRIQYIAPLMPTLHDFMRITVQGKHCATSMGNQIWADKVIYTLQDLFKIINAEAILEFLKAAVLYTLL